MISTYCIKSLENGNFMRVSQMNWAIFIRCLRHPRRFRLRFLTQTHTHTETLCMLLETAHMDMITLLRVRAYEKSKLLNNYTRLCLSLSRFLLLTHTQSPSLILIWCSVLVCRAHDYYQMWSKSCSSENTSFDSFQ